jgi:hypothetical protein
MAMQATIPFLAHAGHGINHLPRAPRRGGDVSYVSALVRQVLNSRWRYAFLCCEQG